MANCKQCNTTEQIIYSGTDALVLGIPGAETGIICYPCANNNTKPRRYNFDGFTFGSDGDVNLDIFVLKGGYGGWTTRFAIEFTVDERLELIRWLQNIDKEKN
jgi:hypothetical protein